MNVFTFLEKIVNIAANPFLANIIVSFHFLGPFELIDEDGDGNITRDEWQEKIEKVMDKVMYITNVTLTDDYEDLYDDIWEALDCDNGTTQLLISRV